MHSVPVKPLTNEQLTEWLNKRLNGGLGSTFGQFANMFVVGSAIDLGHTIGLVTSSEELEKRELIPVFPQSYQPTLREFLDAIAAQTGSEWKYDRTGNFIKSDDPNPKTLEDTPIFEFTLASNPKTFAITLAKGWQAKDHCTFMSYIPPVAPFGLDIYDLGTYSSQDKTKETELWTRIPRDISLEWARRVQSSATESDLKKGKVGQYEAVFFDAMIPSKLGKNVRWRQWVFMARNRAYIALSTIFPEQESKIFPDVEAMLKTFHTAN